MNIFTPRTYQQPFLDFMSSGGTRAFLVWHRRAGKNMTVLQWLLSEALLHVGLYYYVFPSLKQGRKILWDGKTGNETENKKFMDYIEPDWIWPNPSKGINNTDMTIKLKHPEDQSKEGSIIQIVGTMSEGGQNEAKHLRGTNPRGIVMDEYSEHNPVAWEILSPILTENGGWAVFTMTPKGPNHAFKMYNNIRQSSRWYSEVLDVTTTKRADGSPVITQEAIDIEREEGKDEAYIQQEYYCSWAGIQKGSYYTLQLDNMYKEGRVKNGLYRPELDCITAWDIGHEDATVVLIGQPHGPYTYWVDGFKVEQRDLRYCWNRLQDLGVAKGYRYAAHYMPWDMAVHEWASSIGRLQAAKDLGMRNIRIAPKLSVSEGRDMVRRGFANWYFEEETMMWAISDMGMYSASWDEKHQVYTDSDAKSPHKHTADAFRTYETSPKIPSHDLIAQLPTRCNAMHDLYEDRAYANGSAEGRAKRSMYRDPSRRVAAWV